MKLAAVTGATGMIGRRVVEQLRQLGCRIRVMQRSAGTIVQDCEIIVGDLASDESIGTLLNDVDTVFHCAAELHDEMRMHDVNVLATERLARIALEQGVKCFVHISSAGVIGPVNRAWVHEADDCHPYNAYEVSKWQAEQALLRWSRCGMRVCMLRPVNVVDDKRPGMLTMALRDVRRDNMSLFIKGGEYAHLVHAQDVAGAAVFLAEHDECVGAYFAGCDEDARNTVVGVVNIARRILGEDEYQGPVLPVAVPYFLRCLRRRNSLHGKTRFSSAKLTESGFEFPLGLDGAVERVCSAYRLTG